jgi:phosphatidylinositol alpha 1,6-mannosyltransferase
VTGFLVTPGDAAALTSAVARLVADPALRAAQGKAGRQMVVGRTWPALVDELIRHYHDVLAPAVSVERTAAAA